LTDFFHIHYLHAVDTV